MRIFMNFEIGCLFNRENIVELGVYTEWTNPKIQRVLLSETDEEILEANFNKNKKQHLLIISVVINGIFTDFYTIQAFSILKHRVTLNTSAHKHKYPLSL